MAERLLRMSLGALCALCQGCPLSSECRGTTEAELRQAALDDHCIDIRVEETQLTSLAGLEDISHPANIFVVRNPDLVDVSAIDDLDGDVLLENNTALVGASLGVVAALSVDDENDATFPAHQLETLSFLSGEPFAGSVDRGEGPRTTTDLAINQNGDDGSALREIAVGCSGDCLPLSLSIRARHGITPALTLNEVRYQRLSVTSENITLQDLQGLLVPTDSVALGLAPRALAEQYLAWLEAEGFSGSFVACVFDGDVRPSDCEDRVTSP